jgi:hypothetical protein
MQLQFKKIGANSQNSIGTLKDLAPKGTKIAFNPNNLANNDARVVVHVINKDTNEVANVYCSPRVSEGVRNKSISLRDLVSYPVTVQTTSDRDTGEEVQIHTIGMIPHLVEINTDDVVATDLKSVTTAIKLEDLIAL